MFWQERPNRLGGCYIFVYTSLLDAGDIITDFEIGIDKINLTAVLDNLNYQGTDAIADGFIQFGAANISDTLVSVDPDGFSGNARNRSFLLVQNVAVNDIAKADNFIL